MIFAAAVPAYSRCLRTFAVQHGTAHLRRTFSRSLCSGMSRSFDSHLLPQSESRLDLVGGLVSDYQATKSLETLDQIENMIMVERHVLELNGRLRGMLGGIIIRFFVKTCAVPCRPVVHKLYF
jgi:hypothetical protein